MYIKWRGRYLLSSVNIALIHVCNGLLQRHYQNGNTTDQITKHITHCTSFVLGFIPFHFSFLFWLLYLCYMVFTLVTIATRLTIYLTAAMIYTQWGQWCLAYDVIVVRGTDDSSVSTMMYWYPLAYLISRIVLVQCDSVKGQRFELTWMSYRKIL